MSWQQAEKVQKLGPEGKQADRGGSAGWGGSLKQPVPG